MKITRKDALELADKLAEDIVKEGYLYWIYFKGVCIPYNICMHVLKQFIETSSLVSIELDKSQLQRPAKV